MKNKRTYLFILASFQIVFLTLGLFYTSSAQDEGELYVRNYSPLEYKANSQNWAAIQGNSGMMFFGNNKGVLVYDGNSWEEVELTHQSIVRTFAKDIEGKIYVGGGCDLGFLKENYCGKIVYQSLLDSLPENECNFKDVWHIHCSGSNVYFVTDQSLIRLSNEKFKSWESEDSFGPCISVLGKDYVHYWEKGIVEIGEDSLISIPNGDFFKEMDVRFCLPLSKEKILVATMYSGLYTFDLSVPQNDKKTMPIQKFSKEIEELLKNEVLYSGCLLPNGQLALGSTTNGVYIFNKERKLERKINTELRNNMIYAMYADRDENLWLATNNGISKIDIHTPISFWDIDSGIESGTDFLVQSDSTLFLGGFRGIQYLENGTLKKIPGFTGECLSLKSINHPEDTLKKILLASSVDHGVVEVRKASFLEILDLDPWGFCQSEFDPSLLYLATERGFYVAKYKFGKWNLLGKVDAIDEHRLSRSFPCVSSFSNSSCIRCK